MNKLEKYRKDRAEGEQDGFSGNVNQKKHRRNAAYRIGELAGKLRWRQFIRSTTDHASLEPPVVVLPRQLLRIENMVLEKLEAGKPKFGRTRRRRIEQLSVLAAMEYEQDERSEGDETFELVLNLAEACGG